MEIIKKNTLYIYTDGSSLPNPRSGGIGIRYIYLDKSENEKIVDSDNLGYKSATNNQMELKACIEALKEIPALNIEISYNLIEIRTDSMYVKENVSNAK